VDEARETQGTYEKHKHCFSLKISRKLSLCKHQHVREEYSKTDLTQDNDITYSHPAQNRNSRGILWTHLSPFGFRRM